MCSLTFNVHGPGMSCFQRVQICWSFIGALACLVGCRGNSADTAPSASVPSSPAESYFVDASLERGVDFVHDVGRVGTYFMPESLASGGAFFDYDGDGDLDIYLINGEDREKSGPDKPTNRLYQQQSDGHFVDVTAASGLGDPRFGMGVAVADIDNDGDLDVYVSNYGLDRLFRNNGDGTFADITDQAGIANPAWGTSAGFFDYDADGWLDLMVTNYVDYYPGAICEDDSGQRDYCGPKDFEGTVDRLFHNRGLQAGSGDVAFEDVTVQAGIATATGRGWGWPVVTSMGTDARISTSITTCSPIDCGSNSPMARFAMKRCCAEPPSIAWVRRKRVWVFPWVISTTIRTWISSWHISNLKRARCIWGRVEVNSATRRRRQAWGPPRWCTTALAPVRPMSTSTEISIWWW